MAYTVFLCVSSMFYAWNYLESLFKESKVREFFFSFSKFEKHSNLYPFFRDFN